MGKRLGKEIPKAFVPINGKELFLYSVEVFDAMSVFNEIIIVVPSTAIEEAKQKTSNFSGKIIISEGGKERHNSVENGIKNASGEIVLIHDAARPFITKELVGNLLENYTKSGFSGVISANPVVDTVRKTVANNLEINLCGQTVNRDDLIAVGTPQVFDKKILLDCFAKIEDSSLIPTDEAMLVQNFGYEVGWVKGSKLNFKVTTPEDIILAEAVIGSQNV